MSYIGRSLSYKGRILRLSCFKLPYYKFSQDYIFKKYMDRNNKIKAQATKEGNELLRKLPKDLSNIIFGKTIQDILKQRNFEIVYVSDNKQVSRLNYISDILSMKRISEKLIIFEKEKKVKKLDMPIYVGKAVLDLSKHLMYDFFYNVVM